MTIELITPEQYATLLDIYNKYPALSFQNNGYEYLDMSKLTNEELEKFKEVEDILRKAIKGFSKFNHFRLGTITKEPQIRFQYNWNADIENSFHFTGVGYLFIDELKNGFKESKKK